MQEKAYAKINLYLKITGHKDGYHTLNSRFLRVDSLYDTLTFVPQTCSSFTIEGVSDVTIQNNTIYKAFVALNDYTGNLDLLDFFYNHKVVVDKKIPTMAGLGGGSSDAAAFLRATNRACRLGLNSDTLASIGANVGADVPFFVYNYRCANVSGFGEIIKEFEEREFDVELLFPNFGCDTSFVYKAFKTNLTDNINPKAFENWEMWSFNEIEKSVGYSRAKLNDLYEAATLIYPQLKEIADENCYFSGSGSTFFKLR